MVRIGSLDHGTSERETLRQGRVMSPPTVLGHGNGGKSDKSWKAQEIEEV